MATCDCAQCCEDRSRRARIAALTRNAGAGRRAGTNVMNANKFDRYMQKVDPDNVLDFEERQRRATALLRADMQRLSMRAAQKRKQKQTG